MTREEKIKIIDDQHKLLYDGDTSKVVCGPFIHYGCFIDFDDHKELKEQGKFRFVRNNNYVEFQSDMEERAQGTGLKIGDPKYSMIIDVDDISELSIKNKYSDVG